MLSEYLASAEMQRLNPDPLGMRKENPKYTSKPVQVEPIEASEGSKLEIMFYDLWVCLEGPKLKREQRFHPERRWRLDFLHEESMTAIEIDGAIFVPNRGHSSGKGITRDMEKSNELCFMGYRLFRLSKEMITADFLKRMISFITFQSALVSGKNQLPSLRSQIPE